MPFNVNYRYTSDELAYLLTNADADVLVYHSSLADAVAAALPDVGPLKALIEVDDGGAAPAEQRPATRTRWPAPSPAPRIASGSRRRHDDLHRRHHRDAQGRRDEGRARRSPSSSRRSRRSSAIRR